MRYLFLIMLLTSCSSYDYHFTKKSIELKCISTEVGECSSMSDIPVI
jgi:hypothetical protein